MKPTQWFTRMVEMLKRRDDEVETSANLTEAQFLDLIDSGVLIDEAVPLHLVRVETIQNILLRNLAFYDKRNEQWWLTQQGAAWLHARK